MPYFLILTAIAVLAGCAGYDGRGLLAGQATREAVIEQMGTPAETFALADGRSQLVYPRGPMGLHTYMVYLDAAGRLERIESVLDDAHFARVRPGETTRDEVRRILGPPAEVTDFPRRGEQVWDYRFRNAWSVTARFVVIFDSRGIVRDTYQHEEYRGEGMFDLL